MKTVAKNMSRITLKPFPYKQSEFILDNKTRFLAMVGGVGSMKTIAALIKVMRICETDGRHQGFIIRREYPLLEKSVINTWFDLFPHTRAWYKERVRGIFFPNGAVVYFVHGTKKEEFLGPSISFIFIDQAEELDRDIFEYLAFTRLRSTQADIPQQLFLTANPNGHDFIYEMFKLNQDKIEGCDEDANKDFRLIEVKTHDNPYLPREYLNGLKNLPPRKYRRYVEGSWEGSAGQVYEEFSEKDHVHHPSVFPSMSSYGVSMDYGGTNPTACYVYGIDFDGNVYVLDEYYESNKLISQYSASIKDMLKGYMRFGSGMWADPSIFNKTREKNNARCSIADEFADFGLFFQHANNEKLGGIKMVEEYFHIDPERIHPFLRKENGEQLRGSPRLFISKTCVNMIRELREYHYPELRESMTGSSNDPEEPVKVNDHSVDSLRYFIMTRPKVHQIPKRIMPGTLEAAFKELDKAHFNEQRNRRVGRPVLN